MPPSGHILSFAEYAAIRHPTPYVVDVARGGSRLVLFGGAQHRSGGADVRPDRSRVPESLAGLRAARGTPPAVELDREIAIRRHGESGLVRHLAARAGIDTASMDMPLPEEARRLRHEMALGDVLVFFRRAAVGVIQPQTARRISTLLWRLLRPHRTGTGTRHRLATHRGRAPAPARRPLSAPRVTALETDPLRRSADAAHRAPVEVACATSTCSAV